VVGGVRYLAISGSDQARGAFLNESRDACFGDDRMLPGSIRDGIRVPRLKAVCWVDGWNASFLTVILAQAQQLRAFEVP
jgi:hypothetical protein